MPIRQKDSDLDGDSLTGAGVSDGTIATSELEGSNLRYIAGPHEKGTDTLTYEVVDGKGGVRRERSRYSFWKSRRQRISMEIFGRRLRMSFRSLRRSALSQAARASTKRSI